MVAYQVGSTTAITINFVKTTIFMKWAYISMEYMLPRIGFIDDKTSDV